MISPPGPGGNLPSGYSIPIPQDQVSLIYVCIGHFPPGYSARDSITMASRLVRRGTLDTDCRRIVGTSRHQADPLAMSKWIDAEGDQELPRLAVVQFDNTLPVNTLLAETKQS
jgi:hypothetical protein